MNKIDQEIREARDAARVLNDPLFVEAFDKIERGIISAMKQAKLGDRDTQHELVLTLQLLGRLRGSFEEAIQTGKMAEIQKGANERRSHQPH